MPFLMCGLLAFKNTLLAYSIFSSILALFFLLAMSRPHLLLRNKLRHGFFPSQAYSSYFYGYLEMVALWLDSPTHLPFIQDSLFQASSYHSLYI
jgi:hypothetical protein